MSIDGQYTLETPENVEVDFELAGPGSRFCAMLIDGLMMFLIIVLLLLLAVLANFGVWRMFPWVTTQQSETGNWLNWVNAILIFSAFVVLFGYYTIFELLMRGQTPGKRAMKIRVIRDDGTPAGGMDVVVRNLIRIVDALPGFYAIGGAVAFFHPMNKRLGDLAAGTIVVKERELDYRAQTDKRAVVMEATVACSNAELEPDERQVLTGFLRRRVELLPDARNQLAERLAKPLFEKYGGTYGDSESYIERLLSGRHADDPVRERAEAVRAWMNTGKENADGSGPIRS